MEYDRVWATQQRALMPLQSANDVHERFFLLAGLVRHEFWLHGQKPEDYGFVADADTLTIRARKQEDHDSDCELTLTDEMLFQRDLHALASEFYARICKGRGGLRR